MKMKTMTTALMVTALLLAACGSDEASDETTVTAEATAEETSSENTETE